MNVTHSHISQTLKAPPVTSWELGEFWSAVALHGGQNVGHFLQFDTQNITLMTFFSGKFKSKVYMNQHQLSVILHRKHGFHFTLDICQM